MLSTQVERLDTLLQTFDQCRIESFDGNRLLIIGCWNLSYHHNFEAEFAMVNYTQCATYFYAQKFRMATPQEKSQLNLIDHIEEDDQFFCFESDENNFSSVWCFTGTQKKKIGKFEKSQNILPFIFFRAKPLETKIWLRNNGGLVCDKIGS